MLITLCLLLFALNLKAQFDSLNVEVGTFVSFATEEYQPFGSLTRKFGVISDRKYDASSFISVKNVNHFNNDFSINYGASFFNNNGFGDVFLQEGFIEAKYKKINFLAGQKQFTTGDINHELTSGSLAQSDNARPLPQVRLTSDYINIPLTDSLFKFKFSFAHAWLGDNRRTENPLLHEKSLYLKIGRDKLSFYGGFIHYAIWAGSINGAKLPNRFKDYARVLVGAPQAQDGQFFDSVVDTSNALGSHMGIFDLGMVVKTENYDIQLYTQSIYERGYASKAAERDRIEALGLFHRDRLVGATISRKDNAIFKAATLEFLYTKYQGGEIIFEGRHNFYNNATYRSGWTNQGRILGTPLFVTQRRANLYFDEDRTQDLDGREISSNRMIAIHGGWKLQLHSNISSRSFVTYTWNYGNYYNDEAFTPVQKQLYIYQEMDWNISDVLNLNLGLALDSGDMTDNFGMVLGVRYRVF